MYYAIICITTNVFAQQLKWKFKTVDYVFSSPAIAFDKTIYFGSGDIFYAIKSNGKLKWKLKTGEISSPAVSSDGTIYCGTVGGGFYAINPDGSIKWKKFFEGDELGTSSPVISSTNTIYFGRGKYLYAIDINGEVKWKYLTGLWPQSSAAIAVDGTVYFGSSDDYFYALNSQGKLKWKYKTLDYTESSPTITSDGTIYFGSCDNINLKKGVCTQGALYAFKTNSYGLAKSSWPKFRGNLQNTGTFQKF